MYSISAPMNSYELNYIFATGSIDAFQFPYAMNFPYIDKEVMHRSVGDKKKLLSINMQKK